MLTIAQVESLSWMKDAPLPIACLAVIVFLVVYFLKHLREISKDHKDTCIAHDTHLAAMASKLDGTISNHTQAIADLRVTLASVDFKSKEGQA